MLTEYNVLKPDVPRAGYAEETYELWRLPKKQQEEQDWAEFFAKWKENPRIFDPMWRNRIVGIQVIIDAQKDFNPTLSAHWFWGAVRWVFTLAIASWTLGAFYLALRGVLW